MNIVSRTKEGRQWERQYKKQVIRLWQLKQIIKNAEENHGLETCEECENLKVVGEDCKECGY